MVQSVGAGRGAAVISPRLDPGAPPGSESSYPVAKAAGLDASASTASTAPTVASGKSVDPISVDLSEAAARMLERTKPVDVGPLQQGEGQARGEGLASVGASAAEDSDPFSAIPPGLRHAATLEKLSRIAREVLARFNRLEVDVPNVDGARDRLTGLNSLRDWARLGDFSADAPFSGAQTGADGSAPQAATPAASTVDSAYLAKLQMIAARFDKISKAYAQARDPNTADVGAMSPAQAQARLDQLVGMSRVGFLKGMTVSAVFGQDRTESMDVYMSWLEKRANETVSQAPTTGLDVKV